MPHCVKVRISKQTGFMDYASRYDASLALISRGQFYAPAYLWFWNKIFTHLNLILKAFYLLSGSPQDTASSLVQPHTTLSVSRGGFRLIRPFIMDLVDLRHCRSWPSFCSSQTEEPLSRLSLRYVFCLVFQYSIQYCLVSSYSDYPFKSKLIRGCL